MRGIVEETLELGEGVYLDLDARRRAVGMEFLSMEDFDSFLDRYPDGIEIAEQWRPDIYSDLTEAARFTLGSSQRGKDIH